VPFITGYVLGRGARMALFVYLTERYGVRVLDLIKKYLVWAGALMCIVLAAYAIVHWHLLF
jgi:hypothetical protein